MDEDARKYANRLKPGIPHGSSDPKDYRFGLTEEEIQKYEELADLHHALTLLRYGSSKLYPYLSSVHNNTDNSYKMQTADYCRPMLSPCKCERDNKRPIVL